MAPAQLSPLFFLQLAIIIVAARAVGWVGRRYLGQPQVVGEMLAGVILGPSLLGIVAPHWEATLFPKEERTLLYVLSQFGVGLYMFIVGLGFRSDHFRTRAKSAVAVSLSGMAVPFGLALLLSPWLVHAPGLFGRGVAPLQATLFLGAAIAITAFPMLARIIRERGLSNSRVGTLALAAGAIDDASAWAVLAIVLATLGGDPMAAAKAIGGGLLFAVVAVMAGPRLLAPLARHAERFGVDTGLLALTIGLYALCAGAMDFIVCSRISSHRRSKYSPSRLISGFGRAAPAVRTISPMPRGTSSSAVTSFSRRRSAAEVIFRDMPPPLGELGISTQ